MLQATLEAILNKSSIINNNTYRSTELWNFLLKKMIDKMSRKHL